MIREQLIAAEHYARKYAAGQVQRDLRLEALSAVLDGTIPLRAHAHAADDIMTAIRIAEEFKVRLTIEHATAGHKVADEIARRQPRHGDQFHAETLGRIDDEHGQQDGYDRPLVESHAASRTVILPPN